MSFVDLATITMHRRTELESRINIFSEKCERAIDDINKLKTKSQGFVLQLNCEPSELKDRFLNCMKQLDEYMYLITDFNLAIGKVEEVGSVEYTPVHDTSVSILQPTPAEPFNLIDVLSEPSPSTSTACSNHCPPEKPKRVKVPKEDQTLIVFSSSSSSEENVPHSNCEKLTKEVQCDVIGDLKKITLDDAGLQDCNLPAQVVLETDQAYTATIMHVEVPWIWLIVNEPDEVQNLMLEMTNFYSKNPIDLTMDEIKSMTYCAFYDDESDCYYRGLFIKLGENQTENGTAEIFAVDTGEIHCASLSSVQPLYPRFCVMAPYARCCHLAGVDLLNYNEKSMMEKQEEFMRRYIGTRCSIEVDDNTSESLGVYVVLPSGNNTLNEIIVQHGLATITDKPTDAYTQTSKVVVDPPSVTGSDVDISNCVEYEDPVEAVTGYHNRDEADICKHYKGGPEKTCFKGSRCTKKHIVKHPDGWTLDRTAIVGKIPPAPLPAPGTWHKVAVTYVSSYNRFYVQFLQEKEKDADELPSFGVVLAPTSLSSLVRDMNSPASYCAYKPLTMAPATGEIVAALYPPDNNWYRARVLSLSRTEQNVEVEYIDYGNVLWVKEDQIRQLEPRFATLPEQAVMCKLAGVSARSSSNQEWTTAKQAFTKMVNDHAVDAHMVARGYDEVLVELYDEGYSIAEHLAALNLVKLNEFSVVDDTNIAHKLVVP